MNILLIDADSKMPNLALMKLSAYHKAQGDQVFLKRGLDPYFPLTCLNPNMIYLSCIFEKNKPKALNLISQIPNSNIKIGGIGIDFKISLPSEIEHIMPDYDLYGIDYSMGFTSRGCLRSCPWCVVPKKEGPIVDNAPIEEFLHRNHTKLILFDNNFLASPKWKENLHFISYHALKVNFSQGLDIRLINEENANLLSMIKYYDRKFKRRRLHFAFDFIGLEKQIEDGINILEKQGIPRSHQMFYVLVGFNSSYEEDLYRIKFLIDRGVKPYVMPYNFRDDSYYPHLKRWVNWRYYKVVSWEKYDHGNSQEVIHHG